MRKWLSWRGGAALCLASALLMTSFGCQPAGHSGSAPSSKKSTNEKPDNKDKSSKLPPADPG